MNVIKKIREKYKVPQSEFAKMLGTAQGAVAYWETEQRYPRPKMAIKIIALAKRKRMKVSMEDIYAPGILACTEGD